MYLYIGIGVALLAILLGWFCFKGKKAPSLMGSTSKKTVESWSKADHQWEIQDKRGIFYCNVSDEIMAFVGKGYNLYSLKGILSAYMMVNKE